MLDFGWSFRRSAASSIITTSDYVNTINRLLSKDMKIVL